MKNLLPLFAALSLAASAFGVTKEVAWAENPMVLSTEIGMVTSHCLAQRVTNPKGVALKFAVSPVPAWAKLNGDGCLVGTPTLADHGMTESQLTVTSASGESDTARAFVFVFDPNDQAE